MHSRVSPGMDVAFTQSPEPRDNEDSRCQDCMASTVLGVECQTVFQQGFRFATAMEHLLLRRVSVCTKSRMRQLLRRLIRKMPKLFQVRHQDFRLGASPVTVAGGRSIRTTGPCARYFTLKVFWCRKVPYFLSGGIGQP